MSIPIYAQHPPPFKHFLFPALIHGPIDMQFPLCPLWTEITTDMCWDFDIIIHLSCIVVMDLLIFFSQPIYIPIFIHSLGKCNFIYPGTIETLIARFMGPTWSRQDPGWPHVGHVNFAIWEAFWSILGLRSFKVFLDLTLGTNDSWTMKIEGSIFYFVLGLMTVLSL